MPFAIRLSNLKNSVSLNIASVLRPRTVSSESFYKIDRIPVIRSPLHNPQRGTGIIRMTGEVEESWVP